MKAALMRSGIAAAAALLLSGTASAYTLTVDVAGIFSNEDLGAAMNEVRLFSLVPDAHVINVSWNVTLFADSPSWLSEIAVDIGDGAAAGFSLSPGFGVDAPGTDSFAGSADLVALGTDFYLGASGQMRLEFFERFNDFSNDWDGQWLRGSLTIEYVPEPATYGLAALALIGAGVSRRRRAEVAAS